MALIQLTTVDDGAGGNPTETAAQTQKLKTALTRVDGLRVVEDRSGGSEAGTKSGAASLLGFALEVATSPHTVAAVGVVLFEWLRHSMGRSIQLVVEGEKILVESGSHKRVEELVELLERKLSSRAE
ncbi:MAG TPA: hypothetical protein VG820_04875 [Fimbriimonadaceae bacterium]|nr:hypothetical protein [Fimbriimonadaceae bacterium]